MASPRDILLGDGLFSFREAGTTTSYTDVAVTRGGGNFSVNNTYRNQEADGDRGPVQGRIAIDEQIATLTMRALELVPGNINDFYPAMNSSAGAAITTLTGLMEIASGDYKQVKWTGRTKGGNAVNIDVNYAINMEPLSWDLIDKDEVVPELVFTSCYTEALTSTPNWTVTFATT